MMPSSQLRSTGRARAALATWNKGLEAARLLVPRARVLLKQTSWRQRALLALALVVPLFLSTLLALHQRSEIIAEARESAQRSVVALEQHAANVVDTHALILRQVTSSRTGGVGISSRATNCCGLRCWAFREN